MATIPSSGDDVIFGTIGSDTIDGLEGNDEILGLEGNDVLTGGLGNDRIYGGSGDDQVSGGDGADLISGGDGNDVITDADTDFWTRNDISGGLGNDLITLIYSGGKVSGDEGDDQIYFTDFTDGAIYGGTGDDIISGSFYGIWPHTLSNTAWYNVDGGIGNDTITLSGGADFLNVYGGDGNDVVDISGMLSRHAAIVFGGAGSDMITVRREQCAFTRSEVRARGMSAEGSDRQSGTEEASAS